MTVNPIPEGYHTLTPYLVVDDVERVIDFLKAAFDAAEKERIAGKDGRVGHAELRIGDSHVMLGRAQPQWPARPCMIYVYVPDADATWARALAAGGTSEQEPADMFYGDRNAGVKDPAGNSWWIATHKEDVAPEEMARRAKEHMA